MVPRAFGLALLLSLPVALAVVPEDPLSGPRMAAASVSVAVSLEELVGGSTLVVVATAAERESRWEELGGAKRIVTYTRLTIDRAVVGEPGKEVWVRTLGGVVGNVGQHVAGDARIAIGSQSLLFLTRSGETHVVSAMAQGHYPLVAEGDGSAGTKRLRLAGSPDVGGLLPRPGPAISAREVLVGATLDQGVSAILRARQANHAKK
jgi:hypothetical protein